MLPNGSKKFATAANQTSARQLNDAHGCRKRSRQSWTQKLGIDEGPPLGNDASGRNPSAEDNQILDLLDEPLANDLKRTELWRGSTTYPDPCCGISPRNEQGSEEVSIELCMS